MRFITVLNNFRLNANNSIVQKKSRAILLRIFEIRVNVLACKWMSLDGLVWQAVG